MPTGSFLDFLAKKGLIDPLKLGAFQKEITASKHGLEDIVLKKRLIKETDFFKARAEFLGLPFVDSKEIAAIPKDVLMEISEEAVKNYKFIPLKKAGKVLEVGMVNPEDLDAREALKFIASRKKFDIKIFVITQSDFNKLAGQYRTLKGEVTEALMELEKDLSGVDASAKKKEKEKQKKTEAAQVTAEAPISKVVAVIIKHATEGRASDIHIEPVDQQMRVRFRVDGVLHTSLVLPMNIHSAVVSRIKILSNLKIDETRIPQDGRFQAKIGENKIDFRVSTFPTIGGEKIVMRILDPSVGFLKLKQLGLQGKNLDIVQEEIKKPFGMILITGPTGSGKSTTLYSILNILNKDGINIVSLEDPVEYYVDGVNQSQVKPEINYTFASGLRHVLRQDPDAIMVGEIRDSETAELAVHAALTGHIVLSTLHTNNAIGVIPRLIDMGVESFLLPPALNLAAAQRLIGRLCSECKKETAVTPAIERMIMKEVSNLPDAVKVEIKKPFKLYEAQGCKACGMKGIKGRIAVFEMISMTKELESVVVKSPSENSIREEFIRQGMITMKQDGILKALEGVVSLSDVLRVTEE